MLGGPLAICYAQLIGCGCWSIRERERESYALRDFVDMARIPDTKLTVLIVFLVVNKYLLS